MDNTNTPNKAAALAHYSAMAAQAEPMFQPRERMEHESYSTSSYRGELATYVSADRCGEVRIGFADSRTSTGHKMTADEARALASQLLAAACATDTAARKVAA